MSDYFQTIQSCPKAPCQHSSDRDTDIANLTADLAAERKLADQLAEWLLRIVPDQDRDLNDALTEWEARRER